MPSHFCQGTPVAIADPALPPVLVYPIHRGDHETSFVPDREAPLARLLGHSRALILRATATGMTTGELARLAAVSPATASHHLAVLRDSGLISTVRGAGRTLHTLTPAGAALLASAGHRV
ncbi:ArsR/SmtB family transcription factor [Nonomuraea candida]|uniref:ArsR/SmtB family transcription factor n=1 Tax=Nonomuraea candida TaxID=359159 RepID=UPI000694C5AE|nr:winged helix-turn-helix domain-containing protein [Nonomuraea candida]